MLCFILSHYQQEEILIFGQVYYMQNGKIYGEVVSYGSPNLKQIRNKHDYWKDYDLEVEHKFQQIFCRFN